jgi:DNA-binding XRE family transcriptional regulator
LKIKTLGGKPPGVFPLIGPSDKIRLPMTDHATADGSHDLTVLARGKPRTFAAFAAKVGMVRAVLGWSLSEFGSRVGLTRRAISELEQGDTEPRRATARAIGEVWRERGIEFKDLADGGLRVSVRSLPPADLGDTSIGRRSPTHRA